MALWYVIIQEGVVKKKVAVVKDMQSGGRYCSLHQWVAKTVSCLLPRFRTSPGVGDSNLRVVHPVLTNVINPTCTKKQMQFFIPHDLQLQAVRRRRTSPWLEKDLQLVGRILFLWSKQELPQKIILTLFPASSLFCNIRQLKLDSLLQIQFECFIKDFVQSSSNVFHLK